MFKRALLGLVFIASIGWIGYTAFGILTATNDYSEAFVFNEEDGQVLIVNRASEMNFSAIDGFVSSPNFELAESLNSNYKSGYFSSTRPHFLLISSSNWDSKSIKATFNQESIKVDKSKKTFSFGEWSGSYKRDRLYVSQKEFKLNDEALAEFIYDKKASASVLYFGKKDQVESVLDIYFKANGKVDYITRNDNIKQGKQIRDEELFGGYISRKASGYHFYERDYYATIDEKYANSPMSKWLQSGFVEVEYAGEKVLISDYIDGQDPILILNDLQQTIDKTAFKTPLTSTFPSSGRTYFVKYLEDLVVLSQKEEICDQFIADYKLGKTISQNRSSQKRVFGDLPQSVSERYITADVRLSKAVYNGYLLETRFGKPELKVESRDESIAMTCKFDIIDFKTFKDPGEVVALGSKGEINYFKKGKLAWNKTLESKVLGEIQVIELHGGGAQHVLVNSEDAIYLWDLNGNAAPGFPIELEASAINEVKFYRWKDKSYFLITNEETLTLKFDSEGRELSVLKSDVIPVRKIDVWASQGRLFYGFASATEFDMFEEAIDKSLRTFSIPKNSQPVKTPNQLFHYGFIDGRFCQIDQKGSKTAFEKYESGKLHPIDGQSKNPTLIVQSRNNIHLINQNGIEIGKLRMPFNEIESVSFFNLNSGKTVVSIIDGLENNVYLYNIAGAELTENSLEGKSQVHVSAYGEGFIVTTVVDNYVIQYFEN
ncbi:MAG: hypothetical protein P8P74_03635 [Crocinitomicaceae bacterium]|nr:hypothetical protein [Crocinitomicaceae bacterium]